MSPLHVGMAVVCVDDTPPPTSLSKLEVVKGQTYRIRWLGMYGHYIDGEFLGVKLEGIDRGSDPSDLRADDMPFRASRFRPLVHDPLASLRNIAADPDGYVPNAPSEPKRKRVKIKEGEDA